MEYTIVVNQNIEYLIKEVNKLIQEGWIPQGGICESGNERLYFCQAMIRK